MGRGYLFKCKNCKKRYSLQLGIGMLFSEVYREKLESIDKGEYGDEWQKLYKETPFAAVDIWRELFICDSCGNWKVKPNLSLYAPNNPEQIIPQSSVSRYDLEQDYKLLKEYSHICSKCGKAMSKILDDNIPRSLPCPNCGTENEIGSLMMWD